MLIKINEEVFIKFDEATKVSKTVFKSEIEKEATALAQTKMPSDKELVVWAKENYFVAKQVTEDLKQAEVLKGELASLKEAVEPNGI